MLIDARNVVKAFGAFKAVDDASVSVEEGDILGLIGPNGAGKSTFFNCLTGDLPVTAGSVAFAGRDVTKLPPEARAALVGMEPCHGSGPSCARAGLGPQEHARVLPGDQALGAQSGVPAALGLGCSEAERLGATKGQ